MLKDEQKGELYAAVEEREMKCTRAGKRSAVLKGGQKGELCVAVMGRKIDGEIATIK